MREIYRFALDVRTGIEQYEFIIGGWNNGSDAAAVHSRQTTELERGRRENAARIAGRNYRIGFAFVDEFNGAGDRRIFFPPDRRSWFVVHGEHFAGMDDAHAMIAKTAGRQSGM